MSLSHFSIHELERVICETVKKGFSNKLDDADCLQIGLDVSDMLLGKYRVELHPYDDIENMPLVPGSPLEAVVSGQMPVADALVEISSRLEGLSRDLSRWAGITGCEVEK